MEFAEVDFNLEDYKTDKEASNPKNNKRKKAFVPKRNKKNKGILISSDDEDTINDSLEIKDKLDKDTEDDGIKQRNINDKDDNTQIVDNAAISVDKKDNLNIGMDQKDSILSFGRFMATMAQDNANMKAEIQELGKIVNMVKVATFGEETMATSLKNWTDAIKKGEAFAEMGTKVLTMEEKINRMGKEAETKCETHISILEGKVENLEKMLKKISEQSFKILQVFVDQCKSLIDRLEVNRGEDNNDPKEGFGSCIRTLAGTKKKDTDLDDLRTTMGNMEMLADQAKDMADI